MALFFAEIFNFFVFGAIGFWLAVAAVNIALLFFTEYVKPGWATVTFVLTLAFLKYTNAFDIVAYAPNHKADLFWFSIGYVIAGAIWSLIKWQFFLLENRNKYEKRRLDFFATNNIKGTEIVDELKDKWATVVRSEKIGKPDAARYKDTLILWMTYWPWSVLWTLVHDFVKRAFDWVYDNLGKAYDNMADRTYARFDSDFQKDEKVK